MANVELPSRKAPRIEPSDRSLLHRFKGGSQDAATQLYLRYARRVRALVREQCSPDLARCVEIDDLVQSIFGNFFRGASRGHYELPAGDELWRLLLVIALHKIRSKGTFHRAAKRDVRRSLGSEALDRVAETTPVPEQTGQALLRLSLDEALERLPPTHRTVVRLRLDGYEVAEIAQKAERSKRSVERLLLEARQRLADLLREDA